MISFTVPGQPMSKQRPVTTYRKGHRLTFIPRMTMDYQRDIAWAAREAGARPLDGEVALDVRFIGSYADADNLLKACMDGMNGVCYHDDRQVIDVHVSVVRKGKPARTEITVKPVEAAA